MIKQNWSVIGTIWPAFLKCQDFEKPSIQTLLDKMYFKANKDYDSFDNRIKLSDEVVKSLYDMSPELKGKYENNESERTRIFYAQCLEENKLIEKLMSDLVRIASESKLVWKNQVIRYVAFLFCLNSCVSEKRLLTADCMQLFVDSLVHENITVRKIAIDCVCIIMKMVKFKKEIVTYDTADLIREQTKGALSNEDLKFITQPCPGFRSDNQWHHYNYNFVNTNIDKSTDQADSRTWENAKFLDKSYWGYYCWPSQLNVNKNQRANYTTHTCEYSDAVKPILDKFRFDSNFVQKFIRLSTIEESKGNEKFDKKKFYFFKALFRNFGNTDIFDKLYEHLFTLISDKEIQTQECSHKLASELISGLIRGSKYWSLTDLKVLWSKLKPLFDLVIENISNQNLKLWYNCFSTAYEDQDPRRLTFYINYFMELTQRFFPIKDETSAMSVENSESSKATSFQQTSCLHLLNAIGQCEWKASDFWTGLFDTFISNMNHSYKSVREKSALCISTCLIKEIDYSTNIERSINKLSIKPIKLEGLHKFINLIEIKLNLAIELFDFISEENIDSSSTAAAALTVASNSPNTSSQHLAAVNFLQSTFSLFGFYLLKSYQPMNSEVIRIVPQLCSVDKIAAQEVSVKAQLPIMRMVFSMWMLDENCSFLFLEQIQKVIKFKSWHSRLAGVQMLQSFGIFNLFLVNERMKNIIREIIISTLMDEQLEVRLSASLTLTGFIHSNFFNVDENLINHLKKLSKIKPKVKEAETGKLITSMPNIIKRHGGVLGLCSIVNSCPYDIPSYLPDTVTYLTQYINDPVPIQGSVRKCLSEFRRTHHDNWQEHKLNFDESQLSILTDILISPNYYA
jgi:proteasome activator subunit 4